jgi:hypothetical protein
VSLLCQADGGWDALRVVEEVVDAADEVAFETADRFLFGLAVCALSGDVDGGAWVVARPEDREHVERAVQASVPARGPGGGGLIVRRRRGWVRSRPCGRAVSRW